MRLSEEALSPVVILGASHHGSLGVTRSLGRLGAPIYVVGDKESIKPTAFSRYCRKAYRWDLKGQEEEDSIQFLLNVARTIGRRPLLVPTNDHAAIFVAVHAERLSREFLFAKQNAQRSQSLVSKKSLFHLATQHGIPTPFTFTPKCKGDVTAFAKNSRFPVMLKADDGGRMTGAKGNFVLHNAAELINKYEELEDPNQPNLLIQEYIAGGDDSIWMFNGYFNEDSDCLFGMTGKKIRQCPIHTGPSCLAICLHNETVRELTLRFMKAIGYQGILDMGYRFDARDGKYKVLDVNPRIGATFRLFAGKNGMDVARAQYLDLTGQHVPPSPVREGRKWIVEDWDLISSFRYYFRRELTALDWIKSFSGIEECALLSPGDPLPILAVLLDDLRISRGVFGRLRAARSTPRAAEEPA